MKNLFTHRLAKLLGAATSPNTAPLTYAQRYTHRSAILRETRHYSVHLPSSYQDNQTERYPVIYLLDGDTRLLQVAGIVDSFQGGLSPEVPEMIIVGIDNTHRMRDYTPSHCLTLPNGDPGPGYADTGGGRQFLSYLKNELKPLIDAQFRSAKPDMLIGHSLGGLTALDILSLGQADFQAFIAIDPSLWFDYPHHYNALSEALSRGFATPTSLYLAIANNPFTPGFGRDTFHRDNLTSFAHHLTLKAQHNLRFNRQYFAAEDHHSVYHLAVYQGLKWLFDGYRLDTAPHELTLEHVAARYQRLNQRLDSQLKPPHAYLRQLGNKAKRWPAMQMDADEVSRIEQHFYR